MSREMAGKNIILNFFIHGVLIYGVIGERNILPKKTSSEQHKLPVKTITTEHGDVYDCIDFFEQPAFDHPLLKNHDYHFDMKPSYIPNKIPDREKGKLRDRFKLKRVGCPRGSVPIRRTTRENSIKEKPSHLSSQTNDASESTYYAGTATKDGIGKIYGAAAIMSIENPSVFGVNQYSSNIISLGGGDEFLHAGWTVNPHLYGDNNTRFHIWTQVANESCYNTNCPGFVIVNAHYPLDVILHNANTTGGPRYETEVFIYQDTINGNWWLVRHYDKQIGFWPKPIFSTLSDGANRVYYGGVVAVSPGDESFPQMGTGSRPNKDKINGNAFSRQIYILNQDGNEEYAATKSDLFESLDERYVARNYHMHWWNRKKAYASTILFGGH